MDYIDIYPPERLRMRVDLPASKSLCNRALLINALSHSEEMPKNLSDCDDTRVMLRALQDMPEVVDIGAAGTAMRFLTAYLSVTPGTRVITGSERMRHRPIGILVDALRQLGATIAYEGEEGFPPLRITGRSDLQGGELELPGNVSSQYISALLMVAPTLARGLRLRLKGGVVSRPYLEMTVAMMRDFGARVEWEGESVVRVLPVPYQSRAYVVENDWSSASYWYEMVALSRDAEARVVLPGLCAESLQGDSRVARVFGQLGVATDYCLGADGREQVVLTKGGGVACLYREDFTQMPDLAQTVAVTCAMLDVPFDLCGLQTLRIKETDRIAALVAELGHFGLTLDSTDSTLSWDGSYTAEGDQRPAIATYDDHRMAMSFAPACLRPVRWLRILQPGVVSKSYPTYWQHLQQAGFTLSGPCNSSSVS